MRLIWIIALFSGFGFLIYIILWIVIPEAKTTAEKLQMRGAKVNIDNIEKSIKSGVETMNKNVKEFSKKARDYDYSAQADKINSTAGSIGRSTGNVAKKFVRLLAKLIVFVFLIIGIMLLISFTIALLTGGLALAGLGYGFEDIMAFASLIADSAGQARSILFGAGILALMPLTFLIYLGLKLIFGLEPMNVWLKRTIAIFSVIGLIIIISNLVSIRRSFDSTSYVKTTETISLDSSFTLYDSR